MGEGRIVRSTVRSLVLWNRLPLPHKLLLLGSARRDASKPKLSSVHHYSHYCCCRTAAAARRNYPALEILSMPNMLGWLNSYNSAYG